MVREFFKVLRFGTLEELTGALNYYLHKGWYVEELGKNQTDFFQEHICLLVNDAYLKHRKKYFSYFEEEKQKQEFKISLNKDLLNKRGKYVKK